MTDAAAILEVRHVRLAEQATLRPASLGDGEEGVFVALDDPPPVRTVLSVMEGDRRRALEVAWVVEVAERDEVKAFGAAGDEHGGPIMRGFYGRWVAEEALGRAMEVGTEHLEDGTPVVQPVVYDHSSAIDMSDAPVMAMPAPVMIVDDDTGVVDDDEDYAERDDRYAEREEADERHAYVSDAAGRQDPGEVGEEAGRFGAAESDDQAGQYAAGEAPEADQAETSMDSADADEAPEADQAETSTEAGEAPAETTDGDAGDSRSKGRKKRGRKRR